MGGFRIKAAVVCCLLAAGVGLQAQPISPELKAKIDVAVRQVMHKTGVPSATVGIVQDGRVVYTAGYGQARLSPSVPAAAAMRYPIGSITKQFTAACVLLLAEDGKLTLDDHVSKWFPELTRANEVTIRNLLTHTSGYEDYAPQDYTIPAWTKPIRPLELVHLWAGKPLDFDPGTEWQYSNTNFVIAALIVEKVSGMTYWDFLSRRILQPLGLRGAINLDTEREKVEAQGYMQNALAPVRPAILEAPGWYFGDASLAMPVGDLLLWDISLMDRTLLKPASYDAFETDMKLKNGSSTGYGLGVQVLTIDGRQIVTHSGEVGGFVSQNTVFPDDKVAVAVLTNQEASSAAGAIALAVAPLVLELATAHVLVATNAAETQVKQILSGLQGSRIDRGLFTDDCNFYFSAETIADFASSLGKLGEVHAVKQVGEELRGGMTFRTFDVTFSDGINVRVTTYTTTAGKLEQFLVEAKS